MAIEPFMAEVIERLADGLPNRRVLCLGYPDVLGLGEPPTDEERLSVARWHRWKGSVEHAEHFFGRQELQAEYWDVTKARGPEKIVDLNKSALPLANGFGLVIDPGTLEHIANIGNCWRIICDVTAPGALVVHCNPSTMMNHGFYSIHPTAYVDLYEANGFQLVMLLELSGPLEKRAVRELPPFARYQPQPNAVILCVARKVERKAFSWPIQSKYRSNPTLKREAAQ